MSSKFAKDINESMEESSGWAKMLVAPQDHLERAPASTPFLCSKARFVRSFDIPYSDTIDGNFCVVAAPVVEAAAIVSRGAVLAIPQQPISLTPLYPLRQEANSAYFSGSMVKIMDTNGAVIATTNFQDGGTINAAYTGIPCVFVTAPNPTSVTFSFKSAGPHRTFYARIGFGDAVGGISWTDSMILNQEYSQTYSAFANLPRVLMFQLINQSGTPVHLAESRFTFNVAFTPGAIPGAGTVTNYDLIKSSVLDAGQVGSKRCTAMSMLITNMSPPLVSGGELVIARAPARVINSADPGTIMIAIKELPEEKYWRSGAIKEGGYAWWLPDDLSSYEPSQDDTELSPQNILVAAGKMSDPGGLVRVLCTYVYEFYTPIQLFEREYGPTYSPYVQELWNKLVDRPAVSGNMAHAALIAGALGLVNALSSFYSANKVWLQPALRAGVQTVQSKMQVVADKRAQTNKEKRAKAKEKPKVKKEKPRGTGVVNT